MREFFRGWRRKVGLWLLMLAVFLFGQWMSSLVTKSEFLLSRTVAFVSGGGCLTVVVLDRGGHIDTWYHEQLADIVHHSGHGWSNVGRRSFAGIEIGRDVYGNTDQEIDRARWCRIPYWEIIIPVTLLSAYLILWKPRKKESRDA